MGGVGVQVRLPFMPWAEASLRKGFLGKRRSADRHRGHAQTLASEWRRGLPSCCDLGHPIPSRTVSSVKVEVPLLG